MFLMQWFFNFFYKVLLKSFGNPLQIPLQAPKKIEAFLSLLNPATHEKMKTTLKFVNQFATISEISKNPKSTRNLNLSPHSSNLWMQWTTQALETQPN